ncbi:Cupredoxins domain-containing protein, partial [Dioscorea alata]
MATISASNASNLLLITLASLLLMLGTSTAYEFRVGGENGWSKPDGNETGSYNQWATKNRFHIGDILYFKYVNDSVLVVDREDYNKCETSKPVREFTDGNTTFQFDRFGFFYFISGLKEHCEAGQKLIVRVMVHPEVLSPSYAPSPLPNGDDGLSPGSSVKPKSNGAAKLIAGSSSSSVIM